jgi:hypothetical protein
MDNHDVRAYLRGLPRDLYDTIHTADHVDPQRIRRNVVTLLNEGGFASPVEHLWLRYLDACMLRQIEGTSIDAVINRLSVLLAAPAEARMHGLMVAIYTELVLTNYEAGNMFTASMMGINLRLAACDHPYCRGYLTVVGLQRDPAGTQAIETAA